MPRAKLSDILDGLEMRSDENHVYLDRQTGEVIMLGDDDLRAAENDKDLGCRAEWELEMIDRAKAVLANDDAHGGRYLPLPDRFDINEWDMMRDFAASLEDGEHAEALFDAIQGRGAFRCFKDRAHELNQADAWYKFRDSRYRQVAIDWCEAHGVETDAEA